MLPAHLTSLGQHLTSTWCLQYKSMIQGLLVSDIMQVQCSETAGD